MTMNLNKFGQSLRETVGGIPSYVKVIALVAAFLLVSPMFQSAFAGGWEVTTAIKSLKIDGKQAPSVGVHNMNWDSDKDFEVADSFLNPDITIEKGLPYHVALSANLGWIATSDPKPLDFYDVPSANGTELTRYHHWTFGYDVIIKTDADSYYKPFPPYWDYGYGFEANDVEIDLWTSFIVNSWTPSGSEGDWDVVGGWSGIMSSSIIKVEKGLVQRDADENYGHTITDLHSVGAPLNMDTSPTSFSADPRALAGVPSEVDIQTKVTLSAGAQYTTDLLGHWDSVAVRNVFVKYTIRVDLLTVLQYSLRAGHQGPLEDPDEDNTAYQPENTVLLGFFEMLTGAGGWIMQLAVFTIIGIALAIVLKMTLLIRRR